MLSFANGQYILYILILGLIVFSFLFIELQIFNKFMSSVFRLRRTWVSKWSYFFLFLSFICFFTLLLKPERNILQDQGRGKRTIHKQAVILLDTSASMMAQHKGSSRLKRAIEISRRFITSEINTEFALYSFNKNLIKIVPFTEDKDYLLNQLSLIENVKVSSAATDIITALSELSAEIETFNLQNIPVLLLTDGEQTIARGNYLNRELNGRRDIIKLIILGIGNEEGQVIPLDEKGTIKRHMGQIVWSKLDKEFLVQLEEYYPETIFLKERINIAPFLQEKYRYINAETNFDNRDRYVKESLSRIFAIGGIIFFILSCFLYLPLSFAAIFCFVYSGIVFSQTYEIKKTREDYLLGRLTKNKASINESFELSNLLFTRGAFKKSLLLTEEIKKRCSGNCSLQEKINFNLATLLIINGEKNKGLSLFLDIRKRSSIYDSKIKQNITFLLHHWNIETSEQKKSMVLPIDEDNDAHGIMEKVHFIEEKELRMVKKDQLSGVLNNANNDEKDW